jgi:SulP family sulfate permease
MRDAAEIPLEQLALAQGLDAAELEELRRLLLRMEMAAGETLFREGDAGDQLYVLARGAVTIVIAGPMEVERRIVTFAPGAMFGEAAMLDGRARSATATITEDAVLYTFSRQRLEAMADASPRTAVKLLISVGRQLSAHLRYTTNTLRDAWEVRR